MEQTLAWYLPFFSSTQDEDGLDGSSHQGLRIIDTIPVNLPSTFSPVFLADFGSVTTKWKVGFGGGQDGNGFWSFWLHLQSIEIKPEIHVPAEIRKKIEEHTQITVQCQLILMPPPGREDDPLMLVQSKETSFNHGAPAGSMVTPSEQEQLEGINSTIFGAETMESGESGAETIMRHLLEWVDPSNDALHIRVNLKCIKSIPSMTLCKNRFEGYLINELSGILASGQDSDFVIKCGQASDLVIFPVHKFVLSLRSPVFKSMLNSNMTEATSRVIPIEDTEPLIMKQFLNFLYTEKIEFGNMNQEDVIGLLAVGDKYQVNGCKDICFQHLLTKLSKKTCGQLAVAAYLHGADPWQKNLIYEYIAHHWSALGAQKDFQDLVKAYPAAFLKE